MTKPQEAVQPLHLHKQRHVTFQELGALIGTRYMLAKGLMTHHAYPEHAFASDMRPEPEEHGFNMRVQCKRKGCGTVTCIGGAMALIMGLDAVQYVGTTGCNMGTASPSLRQLFYPPYDVDWNKATPVKAIRAIDNWLATGDPKWSKVLPRRS